MVKFTLITGASSGIGKAIAEYCAGKKMNLLLISRPKEQLEKVAHEIHEKYDVITSIPVELLAHKSIENMLKGKFLYIPLAINRFIFLLGKIIPAGILQKILVREFSKEVKVS